MKNKNLFQPITVVALALLLLLDSVCAVCAVIGCVRQSAETPSLPVSADIPDTETTERTLLYLFGERNGRLTVFAPDGETVVEQLDTWLWSLPLEERETIDRMIPVYSVEELISLIEDYTS